MSRRANLAFGIVLVLVGLGGIVATSVLHQVYYFGGVGWRPAEIPGDGRRPVMMGEVDAMFIEQMIPHHDDAIAMADLALTRAERPEIKRLAEDIKRTQTDENARMRLWYREWYGTDVPTSTSGRGGMMRGRMMDGGLVDMEDLADAESFDKTFIEQMIPHHRVAIMMSRMAGAASGRPEIRDLTDSIVLSQGAEIEKMQDWYREWYGR